MNQHSPSPYAWYFRALKGVDQEIHENEPQPGFYRSRRSKDDRSLAPVAIWFTAAGELRATKDGKVIDPFGIWTYACRNPVPEDEWRKAVAEGRWSDDAPPPPPTNLSADPLDAIREQLAGEEMEIARFLATPIADQTRADASANWAARIGEIEARAEETRKREKEPHLEGGRKVDAKWNPLVALAKNLKGRLNGALRPFLQEQERLKRQEQADAERRRREAEAAGQDSFVAPVAIRTTAGSVGKKTGLRKVKFGVLTDAPAFAAHLVAIQHPDMMDLLATIANRLARAGADAPGMEIKEEKTI
jgi:hypothetical protein